MYEYRQRPREERKHDRVGAYCTGEEQLTAGSSGGPVPHSSFLGEGLAGSARFGA